MDRQADYFPPAHVHGVTNVLTGVAPRGIHGLESLLRLYILVHIATSEIFKI